MFNILVLLFVLFNVASLIIVLMSCVTAFISNLYISRFANARIAFPAFSDCKSAFTKCCISSSLFIVLDWIFFSSSFVSSKGVAGKEVLAKYTLVFATIWAIVILLLLIIELIFKFIKNSRMQVKDAIGPTIGLTVWYLLLTFIIV